MRKLLVVLTVTVLSVGLFGAAVRAGAEQKSPAQESAASSEKALETRDAAAFVPTGPINCKTFKCVNKKLRQLRKAILALEDEVYGCEMLLPITQYSGYLYDDGAGGSFPTTALDVTESGDDPDTYALVYVC